MTQANELFKNNVCHRLKEQGDGEFILSTIRSGAIEKYMEQGKYFECLYLLAMLDYVSRVNGIPVYNKYDDLRQFRLERTVCPSDVRLSLKLGLVKPEDIPSIPEFARFNIVESEVRNAV